jgi:glycerophosphoryl diester phosphodiesterase
MRLRRFVLIVFLAIATWMQVFEVPALAFEVQGHRGARARRPENTLPAFEYALKEGGDVLEMDMAVTRDNVIVISHDPRINPQICLGTEGAHITNAPLIHDLTLAQVKAFDCGTLRNPRFPAQQPVPGTTIPTLDEVFDMVQKSQLPAAKKIQFNIETKIFPAHPDYTVSPEQFVSLALERFRKHGMVDRVILQSFDPRTLVEAKKLEPKLRIAALVDDPKIDMLALGRQLKAEIISPEWKLVTATLVEQAHHGGMQVIPWAPNDPAQWDKLLDMKVDAIITDDPGALAKHVLKAGRAVPSAREKR